MVIISIVVVVVIVKNQQTMIALHLDLRVMDSADTDRIIVHLISGSEILIGLSAGLLSTARAGLSQALLGR